MEAASRVTAALASSVAQAAPAAEVGIVVAVVAEGRRISWGRTASAPAADDSVGSLECSRKPMGRKPQVGAPAAVVCVDLLDSRCPTIFRFPAGSLYCYGHTRVA